MTQSLADPRGVTQVVPVTAAPRLLRLEGEPLLLVDNGKLGDHYGPYAAIAAHLRAAVPAEWRRVSHDLLRLGEGDMEPLAEALLREQRPRGVVLALADAGVSVQTAFLAIALERRDVPTVVIATPMGAGLIEAIYAAFAPALRIVVIDTVRTDSPDTVRRLIDEHLGAIRSGLLEPARPRKSAGATLYDDEWALRWIKSAPALAEFQDWAEEAQLGDGLPLLPPTETAVEALLRAVPDDPDEPIYGPALTSGRTLRVCDAAVNAAMTACPRASFPVVLAALRAVARPDYRLSQAAITTHPSGNAIVFSGGDPVRFGLSGGAGCLGPGHRGNASVGRAVALSILHLFGGRPGGADLTVFGSPAEFTYCFAETVRANPWPSLATAFGEDRPGVLVMKAEGPRNVLEHLATSARGIAEALAGAATSICSNNAHIPGDLLMLVNPEHAGILARDGWSRDDLAQAIHGLARLPRRLLEGRCIGPIRPKYMDALDDLPTTRSAHDVHIVVAGAPGPQSMVALPWGYSRAQWQRVATKEEK